MLRKIQLLTILLIAVLALSACSRGDKAAEEEPAAAPPTEAPASEGQVAEEPTQPPAALPTATQAAQQAQPAVTLPTPTPDSAAPPSQEGAAEPAPAMDQVQAVESMESVNTYRMRMTTTFEGPAETGTVSIEGEYVKEPKAQRIVLDAQSQKMETIFVNDLYYFNVEGIWMQFPSPMFDIEGMAPIEPQDVTDMMPYMEEVGVETVNGREAIHYRGNKDAFPEAAMDDVDMEFLQWDLWIDQQEKVVIKFSMEANDNNAEGGPTHFTATAEYYDLNADIVIEAPDVTTP